MVEYRYTGKVREVLVERENQLTTLAIANHLVGKALMNLKYYGLASHYLDRAGLIVGKVMNFPKRDLVKTISKDNELLSQLMRANKISR